MKKQINIILFCLIFSAFAQAEMIKDKQLGKAIVVERIFKVNLNECEKELKKATTDSLFSCMVLEHSEVRPKTKRNIEKNINLELSHKRLIDGELKESGSDIIVPTVYANIPVDEFCGKNTHSHINFYTYPDRYEIDFSFDDIARAGKCGNIDYETKRTIALVAIEKAIKQLPNQELSRYLVTYEEN